MSARVKARKRALDVLYYTDLSSLDLATALGEEDERAAGEPERSASWAYAKEILTGVLAHKEDIDALIARYAAPNWPLENQPVVDRNILRLAIWEIVYNPDIKNAIAISEALELAKTYSTDASPKFLHGILAKVAAE